MTLKALNFCTLSKRHPVTLITISSFSYMYFSLFFLVNFGTFHTSNWVSKCDKRRRWSPHFKMTKMIAILFCEENSYRHSLDPSNYAWNPWRSCRKLEEKKLQRFPAVDELEAINNFLLGERLMSGHKKCYAVLHEAVLRRLNIFFSLLIMTLRHEVFSGQVSQYVILHSENSAVSY